MKLTKCCCCIDLRLGCMLIAIAGIITSCGFFGATNTGKTYYVLATGNGIGILGSICLLFGAYKSHKIAVALYLVAEAVQIVLNIVYGVWLFASVPTATSSDPFSDGSLSVGSLFGGMIIAAGVSVFLVVCVWVYFWLCAFSFFKKIGGEADVPKF